MLLGHFWDQLDATYHLYPYLAIYVGSPFGRYPTFHTLTSVVWKKLFSILPLFRAVVRLSSTNILFSYGSSNIRVLRLGYQCMHNVFNMVLLVSGIISHVVNYYQRLPNTPFW